MTQLSDDRILELIRDEKTAEQGFQALVQQYQERLYHHIRRMVIRHEDTDDVLQNTFLKVWRSIHRFERRSALYTWLYRIATNEALTFLDKRKRKKTGDLSDEAYRLSGDMSAEQYFTGDEVQLLLQKAMGELPDKQRLVFNLRYFDEMSYQEMSDVLGTSVGGLKASYHHAVKKIERYIRNVAI